MKIKTENEVTLQFPSQSSNEGFIRSAVACFAAQMDPTLNELEDIKTAVSEAATNAIVHAYPDRIGKVTVKVRICTEQVLEITVRDYGRGIPDVEKARQPMFTTGGEERSGMGFTIMESFMDSLKVRSVAGRGTTVVMKKKIAPRITIKQDVGSTRPAYCTALGKCQLAYLPEEELDRLIEANGLPRMTPNTICDVEAFKASLREARRLGYAVNRQEANPQVDGIAAPIFDFSGKCIAAISISIIVPLHDGDILEYAGQVVEAAALISSRMGHSVADPQWT